jgi:phosphocarrier protein FPr
VEPVLALIGHVTAAAHAHGRWVGVCGELAGDPEVAPRLVALGVRELSMAPGRIPGIKARLRDAG